jgi:AcrR family transcriptional regulator
MRRDQRLAQILAAGARVLATRGGYGTTMRAVAREARTSLANLYTYVGGREELIYRVHLQVLDVAVASAQATQGARGTRERLRALVTDHVRRVLAQPIEAEILRGGPNPLRGERARRLEDLRRRYLGLVREATDAVLGPEAPRRSDERARLLLGMADRLALDAAAAGLSVPGSAAIAERLAAPVLRLLAGTKGRR